MAGCSTLQAPLSLLDLAEQQGFHPPRPLQRLQLPWLPSLTATNTLATAKTTFTARLPVEKARERVLEAPASSAADQLSR